MDLNKILKYYGLKNGVEIDFIRDVVLQDTGDCVKIASWNNASLPRPTEEELVALEKECATNFDLVNYKTLRREAYPSLAEQLDMQFKDHINGTTTWADAIQAVKTKYPKA